MERRQEFRNRGDNVGMALGWRGDGVWDSVNGGSTRCVILADLRSRSPIFFINPFTSWLVNNSPHIPRVRNCLCLNFKRYAPHMPDFFR